MKVLISGASGLVGKALVKSLTKQGHQVLSLVRKEPKNETEVIWNPESEVRDISKLEGVGAVVHLAGENVGEGRWTDEKKKRIRDSRVVGTKVLCDALLKLSVPPKVFISASATGYYGNRGDEILTEESSAGNDFLAITCFEWERASEILKDKEIRLIYARLGVILTKEGGALDKMLTPFKLGVGGRIGDGTQYISWITLDDVISIINYLLNDEKLSGPFNLTAPNPVTNIEFTETLGKVLSRPTFFFVPKFMLRVALGEMADAALLSSTRAIPKRLLDSGYKFKDEKLDNALTGILK